jgi:hypothetical protein
MVPFYPESRSTVARNAGANVYELGEWQVAQVYPDYHIEVVGACYSLPFG